MPIFNSGYNEKTSANADNDAFLIADSADSNIVKYSKWGTMKNAIQTFIYGLTNWVTTAMLQNNSVTTAKVANNAITAPKIDSASYYSSLALADLNGWKRYVNPVNGKIRHYRSGTATGVSGNSGGFQYVTTGINLPASTRIISATCGVRDQAVSATCILNAGNVRFAAQTFFSPVTPVIDWYWELEEV